MVKLSGYSLVTYNELNDELRRIKSLVRGAICLRENDEDINFEADLLHLAEEKAETSREVLEEINKEYRKLEKEKKEPDQPA